MTQVHERVKALSEELRACASTMGVARKENHVLLRAAAAAEALERLCRYNEPGDLKVGPSMWVDAWSSAKAALQASGGS